MDIGQCGAESVADSGSGGMSGSRVLQAERDYFRRVAPYSCYRERPGNGHSGAESIADPGEMSEVFKLQASFERSVILSSQMSRDLARFCKRSGGTHCS
jgi:hypothetical protein